MNYGNSKVKVFIYADDHPPPHCHVRRGNGIVTRVILPTLEILSGPSLSRSEKELLIDKLDDLCEAYDQKNPKKHEQ